MRAAALVAALALLLPACTFSDGEPWGQLSTTLDARLVTPAGRDAGGGFQKLDTDYQVRFTRLSFTVDAIALRSGGGETALAFDPAHPPPGYTLCHNGHCHRDDGALIDYADVSAELTGTGGSSTMLAYTDLGAIELVPGATRMLTCPNGCTVERGTLGSAQLSATRVVLEGELRDGRTPARITPTPFRADLALTDSLISAELDVPFDREHDPEVALTLALSPSGALLDGLDLATLTVGGDGAIDLTAAANAAAAAQLRANIPHVALTAQVSR